MNYLKAPKKQTQTKPISNPICRMSEVRYLSSAFCFLSSVLCPLFSVASLLFLSIMDCKIVNIEDTPFVRRNQLPAANARDNVTAQPAAIITIRVKMMYFTLTSLKKRSKKRKYTPKTAITRAKSAITTSTLHNNAPAGWIKNASKILPWAKASVAVVIPQVGHGSPYLCLKPQYPSQRPISIL